MSRSQSTAQEMLASMAKQVDEVRKQYPDQNLKAVRQWYTPAIELGVGFQDSLDVDTLKRVNAAAQKVFEGKWVPEVVAQVRAELKDLLGNRHEDLLKRVDGIFRE
ncbi:hypothetical protein DL771_004551 [Monosporascus sp. 5C6A]|nr:hypothetical protein DL771_004551 [Monosporascus sp. 5C6A]